MKLSIIMVNLNNRDGLRRTLESVACQNFTDYEQIVIDGGSTDGSVEVLREYAGRLAYWVSEPDGGIYQGMNKGIRAARGEYCYFLNSGDTLISPDTLAKVFGDREPTEDILSGSVVRELTPGDDLVRKGEIEVTMNRFYLRPIYHQATFIRRELFDRFGYYDEKLRIVGDWKFFIQAVVLGNCSFRTLEFVVSYFESNGISSRKMPPHIWEAQMREKRKMMAELIPPRILADYVNWHSRPSDFFDQQLPRIRKKRLAQIVFQLLVKLRIF